VMLGMRVIRGHCPLVIIAVAVIIIVIVVRHGWEQLSWIIRHDGDGVFFKVAVAYYLLCALYIIRDTPIFVMCRSKKHPCRFCRPAEREGIFYAIKIRTNSHSTLQLASSSCARHNSGFISDACAMIILSLCDTACAIVLSAPLSIVADSGTNDPF